MSGDELHPRSMYDETVETLIGQWRKKVADTRHDRNAGDGLLAVVGVEWCADQLQRLLDRCRGGE